ncbi:substrate-binding domain-containing protein [Oceanisphaera pacifica]|uniref:Substrate-binding domain-containing protein n=1 Tax=Oceanisphaera pacifica TaxID=2818389 RepID=A0ABS3NDL5_9GAMM|nr:substrate-binding domain-containing protein [Oceanisphaera pacifica]MBO1518679.1 substrate-binding domain-containing protein [Oceanisphaera pacifica]
MATIKDVAKQAKVSTSTVSHVLNKTRFVSPEVTLRVEQAMKALQYAPSALARSLKVKETRTLGMLVTSSANPFFAEVVQGVEQRCFELGYSLALCNTQGDKKRLTSNIEMLLQKRVDGIILMCTQLELGAHIFERYPNVPLVLADWGPQDMLADVIQDGGQLGGQLATEHLIALGHRHIGCITGPLGRRAADERLAGFKTAMANANLTVPDEWVCEGDFELAGGNIAMSRLLTLPQRPSAVFIANDMMAAGALRALADANMTVPEQMSIVGYDNIELAHYLVPALTSIEQPKAVMGALAVDTLLARIKQPDSPRQVLTLKPELVIRHSSQGI